MDKAEGPGRDHSTEQVDSFITRINACGDAITELQKQIAPLEKERDALLLQWFYLEQKVYKPEYRYASHTSHVDHGKVIELAKKRFEMTREQKMYKAAKKDVAVAKILDDLFYGEDK